MAIADTNRVKFRYLEEATWGTTPASAMTEFRLTGESMSYTISNTTSEEIRSDRQVTDLVQTSASVGGDINWELSYGAQDDLLEGALQSDWVGVGTGSTETITSGATASNLDFSLNATSNTITLGSSVTHAVVSGQWIKLTGSTADDGYHLVTDATGQVLTVESISTTEVLDETDAATVTGARLRNGTTEKSYTLEKEFNDITQLISYTGCEVNQMSMNFSTGSIVNGTFSMIGGSSAIATSTVGTGAATAAPTNDVMNAVSNIGSLREGGTEVTSAYLNEIAITLNNNLRGQEAVANLGFVGIGTGRCDVTGSFTAYFEDQVLYNKYLNGTRTSLDIRVADAAGNAYVISLPEVEYSGGTVTAEGSNADVMVSLEWTAVRDTTYDNTIQICRFAA
jgi:hypothetical protein